MGARERGHGSSGDGVARAEAHSDSTEGRMVEAAGARMSARTGDAMAPATKDTAAAAPVMRPAGQRAKRMLERQGELARKVDDAFAAAAEAQAIFNEDARELHVFLGQLAHENGLSLAAEYHPGFAPAEQKLLDHHIEQLIKREEDLGGG